MEISEVSICNRALAMIGQDLEISSLTQAGKSAKMCRLFYPTCRDTMQVTIDWPCNRKRIVPARLVDGPAFGYLYQYQLPTNPKCLKVRSCILDVPDMPFEIEGVRLLTDSESCKLIYSFRLLDPTQFSPMLQECIVFDLAGKLAKSVANDARLATSLRQELTMLLLPEARQINAAENYQKNEAGADEWGNV